MNRNSLIGWILGVAYLYSRDKAAPGTYHVFNRASGGRAAFRDDDDRDAFAGMINRYLSSTPSLDGRGRPYVSLRDEVRMYARNILTSHYHLALQQRVAGGMENLMHRVLSTYTRRYNRKYGTSGELFPGEFRARRIEDAKSFKWRIAYIHDNHKRLGLDYRFSTHRLFVEPSSCPSWLDRDPPLEVFGGKNKYLEYLSDREIRNRLDHNLRG